MINNPLLQNWKTPFGTPPFDLIETSHFKPAIEESIKTASEEIKMITESAEVPDFENTIASLDEVGETLGKITSLLFNLNSADTNKSLQEVTLEVSPLLTRFSNDITLNEKLFEKIKTVYDSRETYGLNKERKILTERKYRSFILGGAALKPEERARFRAISEELSALSLKFEENVLEETSAFELHITDKEDLAGLPESLVEMASMEAEKRKKNGWIFTLHFPSYIPFMQYSEKRNLRRKMFVAYSSRAFRKNEFDNSQNVVKIVNLRLEIAKMLGFHSYAEMILGDRMADTQEKVEKFLEDLYNESKPAAFRDFNNIKVFAESLGHKGGIERYDWAFYSEKLKKEKYTIDDEILKPYFSLENVESAILELATTLYNIKFVRNNNIPVYNPEVKTFEVYDRDGVFLSILYLDYHPRPGKNGGAWMTSFRDQKKKDGTDIRPLISLVANFTRPSETTPSLLSFNELTTFLHEFGHSLHGILSKCTYESLSCTNVARDFVELPSQFMENFAFEKQWLDRWAVHYQTGEKIPDEFLIKIKEASTFNEGYSCYRQLSFGFLDMAWHTITIPVNDNISEFEAQAMSKTQLFPIISGLNMSASFAHIFGGGYAAGYYGYKWAEVLDADAFEYFTETGIFNKNTAESFRKNILEKGGTEKPDELYFRFRGKQPSIEALLKRSGLK
ncbi:MAG TPA: M3 family metallopeptidase [Bacteroidales bacterium]|nr:M3 family metallopeptidase [Bacteroidales bacterium]